MTIKKKLKRVLAVAIVIVAVLLINNLIYREGGRIDTAKSYETKAESQA